MSDGSKGKCKIERNGKKTAFNKIVKKREE